MTKEPAYLKSTGPPTLWYLLIAAVISITLAVLVPAIFYPTGQSEVPYWMQGGALGLIPMAMLALVIGAIAVGRHNAAKINTGHRMLQGASAERVELAPRFSPIDTSLISIDPSWTKEKQAEVRRAIASIPGTNDRGESVPLAYRWGGGLSYADGEWIIKTYEFLVLEWGTGKAVELGKNVVYTCDLYLIDHALLDPQLVAELTTKTQHKWVYNKTKTFVTMEMLDGWDRYFARSQHVRDRVNEAQGIDGIAKRVLADFASGGLRVPDMSKVNYADFKAALGRWLGNNGLDVQPALRGSSDGIYAPLYFSEVSRRVRAEKRAVKAEDEAEYYRDRNLALAKRQAQVYSGGYASTRSPVPEVAGDMRRIPGLGDLEQ